MAIELGVLKDERLVRVEANSSNFEDIIQSPFLCLFIAETPLLLEAFLIISHLNVYVDLELVLEPLGELEPETVADVHPTPRPSTRTDEEHPAPLIVLTDRAPVSLSSAQLS